MTAAPFEGRQGGDQSLLDASGEFGDEQLLHNLSDHQVNESDHIYSNSQGEPNREHTDEDQQPQLE